MYWNIAWTYLRKRLIDYLKSKGTLIIKGKNLRYEILLHIIEQKLFSLNEI